MAPPKQGFSNIYIIYGDLTIIFVKQRNGNVHQILLDTDNLPELIKFNFSWHVKWNVYTESYYPRATKRTFTPEGIVQEMVYLYQLFIDYDTNTEEVDHINHDTLDTRGENLRVTLKALNDKNRKGKNKNNKTGYRNVILDKDTGKYIILLCVNNKRFRVGKYYDDVHEAGRDAEIYRKQYYKEYAGVS